MGKVIAGASMSLDGFISDKNGKIDKLYPDFKEMHDVPSFKEMIKNTGAVVIGRRAFEMAGDPDWYAGNYEFQTPMFILTHNPPEKHPKETDTLKFTFVTDGIESAISQAKKAAGEKDIQIIGGASTIQQSLNSGLCDEFHLEMIPVLIGNGLRLFENIDTDKIKFEKIKIEEMTPVRTNMLFRLVRNKH